MFVYVGCTNKEHYHFYQCTQGVIVSEITIKCSDQNQNLFYSQVCTYMKDLSHCECKNKSGTEIEYVVFTII